ncbi:cache domain-containing sensor histidine kinase [Ruminiclostridium cellobioparum]|uniref:Integral membrane sensor signal transduction histidine kinase n=1 Tax=Ruminiclostridium cellobioparum subsp. termitidis CT1112 TaxID=1195236 RepID=S0FFU7_RUMCE|nr:sensor histidine kinase [Ruminiclostridium cellobioparum]EMS69577.1 integral membrane sensor signal transduction histidine kinase [Ruminiclostridium cellobioparum subsp. termitidis CT1112]
MNISIRTKLVLYFLASILVPTLIITSIVYVRSTSIINKKMNTLIERNIDSARLIVEQRLEFINELTTLISINPDIKNVLSSDPTADMPVNIREIITLDRALDSYYLTNYHVFTNSSVVPKIYMVNKPNYARYDLSTKIHDISEAEHNPWFSQLKDKSMVVVNNQPNDQITVARKLYDLKSADRVVYAALLTIDMDKKYFNSLLSSYKASPGTEIYILDENNSVILKSDSATSDSLKYLESNISDKKLELLFDTNHITKRDTVNGRSTLISTGEMRSLNWKIISFTRVNEINADQNNLNHIVILLLSVCMVVALLTAFALSKSISKPIIKLVKSMATVRDHNFEIKLDYKKKDEFGYLIGQYKLMIGQIKELINQLYTSEANKQKAELNAKDAELRALQSQINPHFLYNTLDSINLYAVKYNVPVISDMITSLSNFFRYGLCKGKSVITIEEEIKHMESYMEIQNMRFKQKLKYTINIPRDIGKYQIVKLVLQPLVENSIIHGFQTSSREWILTISGRIENDNIILSVTDNGEGGDVCRLNALLDSDEIRNESIGIFNVHERIRTTYGKEYGLHYYRNSDYGITAEVVIPCTRMGGTLNDNSTIG